MLSWYGDALQFNSVGKLASLDEGLCDIDRNLVDLHVLHQLLSDNSFASPQLAFFAEIDLKSSKEKEDGEVSKLQSNLLLPYEVISQVPVTSGLLMCS
nr:hypothetical protein [Tanacetum cinerariifolium]